LAGEVGFVAAKFLDNITSRFGPRSVIAEAELTAGRQWLGGEVEAADSIDLFFPLELSVNPFLINGPCVRGSLPGCRTFVVKPTCRWRHRGPFRGQSVDVGALLKFERDH
jgi:hypothetical protein